MRAQFLISAARPEQFPGEHGPEYAFLGRSNVGKSSLLNSLLDARTLARTSASPGCTRMINFYEAGDGLRLVDLPGYGYAAGPVDDKRRWKSLIDAYLKKRATLRLCLLLLDARRGWMEKDLELKRWLEFHRRRYLVIATKFDKLRTGEERRRGLSAIREQMQEGEPVPFSALTGQGVSEIWQAIRNT
ncbi:MAG: ribosome biogenesis GTP-binding protein YihA/YsxC [Bryobacteraceae bacterium]|nr:ribosome biogenesis GTP-binding protein YihA/YsxC [Bryobacteraceae bacterium]